MPKFGADGSGISHSFVIGAYSFVITRSAAGYPENCESPSGKLVESPFVCFGENEVAAKHRRQSASDGGRFRCPLHK